MMRSTKAWGPAPGGRRVTSRSPDDLPPFGVKIV